MSINNTLSFSLQSSIEAYNFGADNGTRYELYSEGILIPSSKKHHTVAKYVLLYRQNNTIFS